MIVLCITDGVLAQIRYSVPGGGRTMAPWWGISPKTWDWTLPSWPLAGSRSCPARARRTWRWTWRNGVLFVSEKIDREQICKQSASCQLNMEVFLENPLELFRVEIEVVDINRQLAQLPGHGHHGGDLRERHSGHPLPSRERVRPGRGLERITHVRYHH